MVRLMPRHGSYDYEDCDYEFLGDAIRHSNSSPIYLKTQTQQRLNPSHRYRYGFGKSYAKESEASFRVQI